MTKYLHMFFLKKIHPFVNQLIFHILIRIFIPQLVGKMVDSSVFLQ